MWKFAIYLKALFWRGKKPCLFRLRKGFGLLSLRGTGFWPTWGGGSALGRWTKLLHDAGTPARVQHLKADIKEAWQVLCLLYHCTYLVHPVVKWILRRLWHLSHGFHWDFWLLNTLKCLDFNTQCLLMWSEVYRIGWSIALLREASRVSLLHIHPRTKSVYKHENPTQLPFLGIRWWQIHLPQALKSVSLWHCPAKRQHTWLPILHLNHTTTTMILLIYKMAEYNSIENPLANYSFHSILSNLKSVCNLFCYSSTALAIIRNSPKTKQKKPHHQPWGQYARKEEIKEWEKTPTQTGRKTHQ